MIKYIHLYTCIHRYRYIWIHVYKCIYTYTYIYMYMFNVLRYLDIGNGDTWMWTCESNICLLCVHMHQQIGAWWGCVWSDCLHVSLKPSHIAYRAVQLADRATLNTSLLQSSVDVTHRPPDVRACDTIVLYDTLEGACLAYVSHIEWYNFPSPCNWPWPTS